MVEFYKGKIYDPCCGPGGMFVQSLKFVRSHHGNTKDISICGQELTATTYKLAKMNLAVRGLSANLGEVPADTFFKDQHPDPAWRGTDTATRESGLFLMRSDTAGRPRSGGQLMANPPFNLKDWRGPDTAMRGSANPRPEGTPQVTSEAKNKIKGVDFSKKFNVLVEKYNERNEQDVLVSNVLEDFTEEILKLLDELKKEKESFAELGIDIEEKAFYDILKSLAFKYEFTYPEDKLLELAKLVKTEVDDKAKYTDWSQRDDIKAELKVSLIILLTNNDYPPVDRDEVYKEIFEQAQNFKKHQAA
jgi:hypothetical protein